MEEDAGPDGLTSRASPEATLEAVAPRRGWLIAVAAALTLLTGATAAGGYLELRAHRDQQARSGADAAAVAAAVDCITATQPADVTAVPASQRKLDECATGAFSNQLAWYLAILSEAYQAQNTRVQVPEIHAAVERHNGDGSVVALVVFRAKISQSGAADRESSYRVRVKMVRDNGRFKIAQLDQVGK